MTRGQALVEMALALPLMLVLILGTIDVGDLGLRRIAYQGSASTLAGWAAWHPSEIPSDAWGALVTAETDRAGCDLQTLTVDLGDGQPGSVVSVDLTCRWTPLAPVPGLSGLDVTVAASDVVR